MSTEQTNDDALRVQAQQIQDQQLAEFEEKYYKALNEIEIEQEEYRDSIFSAIFGAIASVCLLIINVVTLGNRSIVRYRASSELLSELDNKRSAKRAYKRINRN